MPTSLDRLTIEAHLVRSNEHKKALEQLLIQKQNQLAQLSADIERVKGAIEYVSVHAITGYEKDLAILDAAAKAAAEAAERSRTTAPE